MKHNIGLNYSVCQTSLTIYNINLYKKNAVRLQNFSRLLSKAKKITKKLMIDKIIIVNCQLSIVN